MKQAVPEAGMVIREDTRLEPGLYELPGGEGITIAADEIEVEGRSVVLRAVAPPPTLPEGDFLYSPGNLGLCPEEHELLARGIELPAEGSLSFEYHFWGEGRDRAAVAVSRDRQGWQEVALSGSTAEAGGWQLRRYGIGPWGRGPLWLKLTVPGEAVRAEDPCFYDAFRLLLGEEVAWLGDAREHWANWYNTGFSILKRAAKRFFAGVGIRAKGCSGVRLRNIRVEGFLTGLSLQGCSGWIVEGCDFSGNYDDPDYGWGDGSERFGAVYLEEVQRSHLRGNRGRRVWNGIVLRRCSANLIERNTFSHCSNTCLKLAQSSGNTVSRNDFSWGLRIYPGEVHARDSVSLLVESGSDGNRFLRNDFRHGGDGVFIRVLNHWCSTGNLFEGNDCSHANNNAIEAWSPGNRYVRNEASWSSYGFWLGGSDDTLLLGNRVRHNGEAFRNAPEPFGNAGISVVHGSSSGMRLLGNRIEDNAGPGLSFAYREDRPARCWLIAGNRIRNNRRDPRGYPGHGALMELCRDVLVVGNDVRGNQGDQLVLGRSCRNVWVEHRRHRVPGELSIRMDTPVIAGRPAGFSITGLGGAPRRGHPPARFLWEFGDGEEALTAEPWAQHLFARPGRRRVCVSVRGGGVAGIATRMVHVLPRGSLLPGWTDPSSWRLLCSGEGSLEPDPERSVLGAASLKAVVRRGGVSALLREVPQGLLREVPQGLLRGVPQGLEPGGSPAAGLAFFYRYACELNTHRGRRNRIIGVRLESSGGSVGPAGRRCEYVPEWRAESAESEDRYDWVYFAAPWSAFRAPASAPGLRQPSSPAAGPALDPRSIRRLEILFGPEEPADCLFWLDAVAALQPPQA